MKRIRALTKRSRASGTTQQVIDVVHALGQIVLLASRGASHNLRAAPLNETGEMRAAQARVESSAVRDLLCGCRLPQIGEREIDPPFLRRQRFEMAFEVFRVVVDQVVQLVHQLAKGQVRPETGHDHEQSGVAAGENLQRPNRLLRPGILAGHRLPQNRTFLGVERAKRQHL